MDKLQIPTALTLIRATLNTSVPFGRSDTDFSADAAHIEKCHTSGQVQNQVTVGVVRIRYGKDRTIYTKKTTGRTGHPLHHIEITHTLTDPGKKINSVRDSPHPIAKFCIPTGQELPVQYERL